MLPTFAARGAGASPPRSRGRRDLLLGGLLGYAAFVVYGSLVPLEAQSLSFDAALRQFAQIPFLKLGAENRADWIANGVLYLPLGVLAARALAGLGAVGGGLVAWVGCAVLAVAVEFAQLWFPPRTVSQNDLWAEGIGAALGVLIAPLVARGGARLHRALVGRGPEMLPHVLEVYAVLLVGFSFFPYDVLLSSQEWAEKLQSGQWGWWWAAERGSLALAILKALAEATMTAPLGLWWALRATPRRVAPMRALLGGLLLGLLIEVGQFAILSGRSEGASVASRGLGMVLGVVWLPGIVSGGVAALRARLRRLAPLAVPPYLAVLLLAAGWGRTTLQGLDAVAVVWRDLHLLPFYYHYYTTEAVALFSLASVVLMYLPLAALGWARGWRPGAAAGIAAMLAFAIEASKLLLAGMRPDPTNVLIAAATCGGLLAVIDAWASVPQPGIGAGTAQRLVEPAGTSGGATSRSAGYVVVAIAVLAAWRLPGVGVPLAALLIAMAAAVAWRPTLAPVLILAALPVLDLSTWTGRTWADEWMLAVLACSGMAWARLPAADPGSGAHGGGRGALAATPLVLFGGALVAAALRTLASGANGGGLEDPMSPLSALWLLQGLVAAVIVLALLRRIDPAERFAAVTSGMVAASALTVAVVLWERIAFVGLFDFTSDYRVTGPFSAMHRGGAYLECFLAIGAAWTLAWVWQTAGRVSRIAAAALLAGIAYAMMVTYSRNGYVALGVVLLLGGLLLPSRSSAGAKRAWQAAAAAALVGVVALPIAWSGFARERIERSVEDLAVRARHWQDAVALHDGGFAAHLFGMGLTRFPELHQWHSLEPARAATLRWLAEGDRTFLRLGPGAPTYVEQWIVSPGPGPLILRLALRSTSGQPALTVSLCEKWMLTSAGCSGGSAQGSGSGWQEVQLTLAVPERHPLRPLKFSLFAPAAGAAVDIAAVRLVAADGRELLANGDFARGAARWFWTTDVDPPWHAHSLPVSLWLEAGWAGVLTLGLALLAALVAALRRLQRGERLAPAALVALAGLLTSGLVNTLIDVPRFLFLLVLLAGLCTLDAPMRQGPRRPTPAGS